MTNKPLALSTASMVELEKVITELYAKKLVTKDNIKELINNLKVLVDQLPEIEETYLHWGIYEKIRGTGSRTSRISAQ